MVSPPAVDIQSLCFNIGSFALQEITLSIPRGEYFVITGPNGSGKSLLMKLICGLHQPLSGDIHINGASLNRRPPWQRCLGYVPQDGLLFPNRTVHDNIIFGLEVRRQSRQQCKEAVARLAALLHIEHLLDRKPQGLSGGESQKVSLARALILEPEVLLLDEPVSAMDENARDEICRELRRIQRRLGITTLHVAHIKTEIGLLADRIATIDNGRLLDIQTLKENDA